jgi:hypothetical protein
MFMTYIDESDDRARKERSPSYPFISLPKAIERARLFSDAHRRSPARLVSVAETWGYAPSSSGLLQTASALKAFGLLEDLGKGGDRKVQLTDLAQRILHDTRPGARDAAIKEAALRPRLFAEYAEKWLPNRPSDSHCLSELRLDRGFTEAASKMFLRSFDDTATFADLKGGDNLSNVQQDQTDAPDVWPESESPPMTAPARTGHGQHLSVPHHGGFQKLVGEQRASVQSSVTPRATLPLPEGVAAIEIPTELSRKSFEALKSWADMMVMLAEKTISSRWYLEIYKPDSSKADRVHVFPRWDLAKSFIQDTKLFQPEAIIRIMPPDDATPGELSELNSIGVRPTF